MTETTQATPPAPETLVDVARAAIAAHLASRPYDPPPLPAPWDAPRAVFVTLRAPNGELRGCIGRTAPAFRRLADEITDCAVGAAARDPRMVPVGPDELPSLRVEVSVLAPPEPAPDRAGLDPTRYGVVVSAGPRRGVLLPDIEGVDDVDTQLRIACRKAGIDPDGAYRVERFRVDKVGTDGTPPIG